MTYYDPKKRDVKILRPSVTIPDMFVSIQGPSKVGHQLYPSVQMNLIL